MNKSINISNNHGIGPQRIEGRESHTTDISRFDIRLKSVRTFERTPQTPIFHELFWNTLRTILEPCQTSIGYLSSIDATTVVAKSPEDILALGQRVSHLAPLHPIHPCQLASLTGISEEIVLNQLLIHIRKYS